MRIKRLKLINFRHFEEFSVQFHENLTVLVARNGAGKSSVLDSIATALGVFLSRLPGVSGISPKASDFRVLPDLAKPPYMRIECETFDGTVWDRTERRDQSKKTLSQIKQGFGHKDLTDIVDVFIDAFNEGAEFTLPVLLYYGTGRGVFDVPQRKRGFRKAFSRFDSFDGSLESRANFRRFVEYFYSLEDIEAREKAERKDFSHQRPELRAIRAALQRFMPEFSNIRSSYPAGLMVDWSSGEVVKQLLIEQLSDGYRTTLAMILDIASRMAEANPDAGDPLDTPGVVLIDEVDLHLHPGWQQRIVIDLRKTFPNIQFIMTTHSPQVVSTVPPESIRIIEWAEGVPEVHFVEFSEGAESQQVLNDVLGVDSRAGTLEIVGILEKYKELVSNGFGKSDNAAELRAVLNEWGAGNEPELIRLDMDMRLQELDLDNEDCAKGS